MEERSPLEIEGMAMVGLVARYRVEPCGRGKVRIVVTTTNGEEYATPCIDLEEAKLVEKHVEFYTEGPGVSVWR